MAFIAGLVLWAFIAALAVAVVGGAAIGLRWFGLLSTDPRLAVLAVSITTSLVLYFVFHWINGFEIPTDNLQQGMYYFCLVGGALGIVVTTLILLLVSWTTSPRPPLEPVANWINGATAALLAGTCIASLIAPGMIQRRHTNDLANYQAALDASDVEAIREILANGYDANDLSLAIEREDLAMMELFLSPPGRKPSSSFMCITKVLLTKNEKMRDRFLELVDDRQAAFNYGMKGAVLDGRIEDFHLMMSLGADPNYQYTNTVLMFAAGYNRLDFAKKLVDAGADVDAITLAPSSQTGSTALIWAVDKQHIDVAKFLLDAGADVNLTAKFQDSALGRACRRSSLPLVELLLANGADPNYKNRAQHTALHLAYQSSKLSQPIIDALTAAGADESATDRNGKTPIELRKIQ